MPETIDREQLQELMHSGAQLVEVLPAKQYRQAHLPNSINIPLQNLDEASVARLKKDRAVIVYCYDYQ
jgi:rhodanese-related sulfurtransferase